MKTEDLITEIERLVNRMAKMKQCDKDTEYAVICINDLANELNTQYTRLMFGLPVD